MITYKAFAATHMVHRDADYIYPRSCASPRETGLGNQLWTLTGWLMIAFSINKTLVLPPFAPWVHEPKAPVSLVPFAELVDAVGFIFEMERIGVRCVVPDSARHGSIPRAKSVIGWTHYKKTFAIHRTVRLTTQNLRDPAIRRRIAPEGYWNLSAVEKQLTTAAGGRGRNATHTDHQFIASAVLRAFHPSALIRRSADALATELRLPVRFGCVHARVERDMAKMSSLARATTIYDYARAVIHADSMHPVSDVFVASGEHVHLPRSYVGPRWRQATAKIDFDDTSAHESNFTYLHASMLDFALCRRASWFVGFGHSSFSRILAEMEQVDNSRGWISVCPGGHDDFASSDVSLLHMIWTLCPVNRMLSVASFGWSR